MISNTTALKKCKYCGVLKDRELFPANPMMLDLRENKCKDCRKAYDQAKRERRRPSEIKHF